MIFRSRKTRGATAAVQDPGGGEHLGAEADDTLDSVEELFERIDALSHENRAARDPQIERRLVGLRHRAGLELTGRPAADLDYPAPDFDRLSNGSGVPEVEPDELTPGLLRAAILRRGCLLVRGLVDAGQATRLAEGIDRAFEARDERNSGRPGDRAYYQVFDGGYKMMRGVSGAPTPPGSCSRCSKPSSEAVSSSWLPNISANARRSRSTSARCAG
jgi:hypothetical protein